MNTQSHPVLTRLVMVVLTLAWLTAYGHVVQAQQLTHLQGRVYLNDTLPAAYATIFLPQHGIGTVTDDQGNYQLDNVPVGESVTVEYAFLGYKTLQARLSLPLPNHRYAHDQRLTEQPIALAEVYLTPKGEDPCTYIFRKLREQGKVNRKRLQSYTALCEGNMHVQDLDVFMAVIPSAVRTMLHALLRPFGLKALFDYVASAPNVDVAYRYTQTWSNGSVHNTGMSILSAQPAIPSKAQQQFSKFQISDFFDLFYGVDNSRNAKKKPKQWQLKGVIEENGLTIDVLTRTAVSDSVRLEYTYYIIEDLWSVLRFESRSSNGSISRYECRDIGGGIYLPVLYVTNPMPLNLDDVFEQARRNYEEAQAKGEKDKVEKGILERYDKVMVGRSSVNINIVTPYTIRYSGVSVSR